MNARIVHQHTGVERVGTLGVFTKDSPLVTLHFGNMIGCREFNINHGFGHSLATSKEAPIRNWKIHPEDLEVIRQKARAQGKVVKPCGKSTGRKRKPRTGPKPHPRQLNLIGSDK